MYMVVAMGDQCGGQHSVDFGTWRSAAVIFFIPQPVSSSKYQQNRCFQQFNKCSKFTMASLDI